MARFSPFAAFRDPKRRPRAVVSVGIIALFGVLLFATSLIGTSFEWFCTTPCHNVHDDNTAAYRQSTHQRVSCIACHEPVSANPAVFTYMKVNVLDDLWYTATGTFELPMNERSEVALVMPEEQCTQCHSMANRAVTPSAGVIIDHQVHSEKGVSCSWCHNRVAHPEQDIELVLENNRKHDDWLQMDACFRCHGFAEDAEAPGRCGACHPASFELRPSTHDAANWYRRFGDSAGHARAAKEESRSVLAARQAIPEPRIAHEGGGGEFRERLELRPLGSVNTCYTCHEQKFCTACHGVTIPHPEDFIKRHGREGFSQPQTCARCHARNTAESQGLRVCNACHHPASTPARPWIEQHPGVVTAQGSKTCLECHNPRYCAVCHVNGPEAAERFLQGGSR